MIKKKLIVVVEDRDGVRNNLLKAINSSGFLCMAEETLGKTYKLLKEKWSEISVVILDMDLTAYPDYLGNDLEVTSGVNLIKKVFENKPELSPAIIVNTGYPWRLESYIEAIKIGAADFLYKEPSDKEKMIPLIQNYSLIHGFNELFSNEEKLSEITANIKSLDELLYSYFVYFLIEQLNCSFQPDSYFLLCSVKNPENMADSIKVYSEIEGLPGLSEFNYDDLHQRIVYNSIDDFLSKTEPARFFKNFIFETLVRIPEIQITIGIKDPFPSKTKRYVFQTKTTIEILKERSQPVIERGLNKLIFLWKKQNQTKIEKLRTSAELSEAILNKLNKFLTLKDSQTLPEVASLLNQLNNFQEELRDFKENVKTILETNKLPVLKENQKSLSKIIDEIKQQLQSASIKIINDCSLPADEYCFSLALLKIFGWMNARFNDSSNPKDLEISIDWTTNDKWLEISVADNNDQKVPEIIKKNELKNPFSSLQLAKLFIEAGCSGIFVDAPIQDEKETGHLFKIKLLNIT